MTVTNSLIYYHLNKYKGLKCILKLQAIIKKKVPCAFDNNHF